MSTTHRAGSDPEAVDPSEGEARVCGVPDRTLPNNRRGAKSKAMIVHCDSYRARPSNLTLHCSHLPRIRPVRKYEWSRSLHFFKTLYFHARPLIPGFRMQNPCKYLQIRAQLPLFTPPQRQKVAK